MNPIIELKNLTREYQSGSQTIKALNNINLTIDEGEFVIILGPSGAGKSTLLNILGGLDQPTQGQIIINNENIEKYNEDQLTQYRAKNIGFIFQFYNLIPNLTSIENIELMKDVTNKDINGTEILESVGLKEHANQFPAQLSGGEQQRVSIARAIAENPTLLLCDEPTGALDSKTGIKILSLLQEKSKENNTTVIIVTHNSNLAQAADKVIHIKNGEIEKTINNTNPKKMEEIDW